MAANKTLLKGDWNDYEEAVASGVCKGGHLLILDSDGKVKKCNVANGGLELLIAVEDSLQGKLVTDEYAIGDVVRHYVAKRGNIFQVRLPAAADAIVIGDKLNSNGDGTFKKVASGDPMAVALEAVDNSGGGSEVFIKVRIL